MLLLPSAHVLPFVTASDADDLGEVASWLMCNSTVVHDGIGGPGVCEPCVSDVIPELFDVSDVVPELFDC